MRPLPFREMTLPQLRRVLAEQERLQVERQQREDFARKDQKVLEAWRGYAHIQVQK